jgi:predicted DNA-binding transcriptional regulator AlpA
VSSAPHPTNAPPPAHTDDELLTLQEVSDVVRVPVATLRYWRHLGTGPRSFRIGRSVRYWRTEVFLWLDSQSAAAQEGLPGQASANGQTRNG